MMTLNQKLVRISVIADKYTNLGWDIFDWEDENSIVLYKELINSVEVINNFMSNPKLLLMSSLELGVDILFSHMAIELQRGLGKNKIITQVVIPYINQGTGYSKLNRNRYIAITQNTDSIIFLSDKLSAREEVEKSRYWRIDNSDCIIMVTNDKDSELIKYARNKKVPITFIRPSIINDIVLTKKKILEYSYPLIFRESIYAGVVINTAEKIISEYAENLLNINLNVEEDKDLSKEARLRKYSSLAFIISKALVEFNNFVLKDKEPDYKFNQK